MNDMYGQSTQIHALSPSRTLMCELFDVDCIQLSNDQTPSCKMVVRVRLRTHAEILEHVFTSSY
jgi:hypothetical protein